ncbi:MAG: heavy metal translocating P-type ATPase [Anaerolineae bacterium]
MPDTAGDQPRDDHHDGLHTQVIPLRAIATNAAECERCAVNLRDTLAGYRGIEVAHINDEGDTLVLHYDPSVASLGTVEDVVRDEGMRLDVRYKHALFQVEGLHNAEAAMTLEKALSALEGVLWAEVNYGSATLKIEYDSALIDEPAIVALARRSGQELIPVGGGSLKLRVTGMDCPDCAVHLRDAIRHIDGIAFADVDFATGTVTVAPRDGRDVLGEVKQAVSEAGYSVAEPEAEGPEGWPAMLREEWPLAATGLLILVGGLLSLAGAGLAADVVFVLAAIVGSFRIVRSGLSTLVKARALSIDFLMTIAVVGAIAIGEYSEGATVVFLFALGEALEGYTMDRARNAIRRLLDLTPRQAIRLREGLEERVAAAALAPGDTILIGPGESLPVDGTIISGQSQLDEATVTGESIPVAKGPGDTVFAGTVNGSQALRVRVDQPASDSTVAHIVRMVEEAQSRRAPSQRLVERFARYYTPAVVVLAAAIAVLPPLVGVGTFREWLYRSLVLLVISCPCALVISTPVAVVSAIARAARRGVVVKGGAYLEELGQVRLLAVDKTGTLTAGRPAVVSVLPLNGLSENELLDVAASIEARSNHPLAAAVVREAVRRGIRPSLTVSELDESAGKGVRARVDGEEFCAGSTDFVLKQCVSDQGQRAALESLEGQGQTAIAVSRDGHLLGCIGLQDSLRPEAVAAMERLRRQNLRLVMLTGDNERTAAAIARQAGIDDFRANLRPEDKRAAITQLRAEHRSVAMVGDGINDAPALAASSVGIAMGAAGSSAALETADVVLMADDLSKLPGAVGLAISTRRTIVANVTLAIAIKGLFLALAVAGIATLWMAVFADVGASLIVILNGMRLLRAKL